MVRMRRRRQYQGFGDEPDLAAAEGAGVASAFSLGGGTATQSIVVGVTSGVLVWTITRLLDRAFGLSR